MNVGLRFDRADAPVLGALVERCKSEGGALSGAIPLLSRAAADAALGEPMLVECKDVEEARILAEGFTLYGVGAPTIEVLSGH